jgi:hypothetical protein
MENMRVIKVGGTLYFKVPLDFKHRHDVQPGDSFQ